MAVAITPKSSCVRILVSIRNMAGEAVLDIASLKIDHLTEEVTLVLMDSISINFQYFSYEPNPWVVCIITFAKTSHPNNALDGHVF
jgi:hypothetical protein